LDIINKRANSWFICKINFTAVSFNGERSYAEIYKAYEAFDAAVKEALPDSEPAIVIRRKDE